MSRLSLPTLLFLMLPAAAAGFFAGMLYERGRGAEATGERLASPTDGYRAGAIATNGAVTGAGARDAPGAELSADPFAGVETKQSASRWGSSPNSHSERWGGFLEEPSWQLAVDDALAAERALERMQALHAEGEPSWREAGRRARGLYQSALARAEKRLANIESRGAAVSERRRVQDLVSEWRGTENDLRKSVP